MPDDLRKALRFPVEGQTVIFINLIAIVHEWSWIPDELPSDQAGVAAVHRIAEHTFDRVLADDTEERCRLNPAQLLILFGCGKVREVAAERFDTLFVNFARRFLGLISVLGNRFDERRFRVSILVFAVRSSKLPVDVN